MLMLVVGGGGGMWANTETSRSSARAQLLRPCQYN